MGVRTTVVFTDLIGSTAVFEALGNVKAARMVTQLTGWIREVCEAHGGRVVKTMGDGVLAVFPQAGSAIDAVVQLQRSHQQSSLQRSLREAMPMRIGVATGDVEVVDNDCYGDAVNVAARLNDLAGPNEILVESAQGEPTCHAEDVHFRSLGSISVRGRVEPCAVYQVEWQDHEPSELVTMLAGPDTVAPPLAANDGEGQQEIEFSWMGERKSFKGRELPIHIGRIYHSDFMVNDPRVSRTHARVEWRNGHIMLVDLSSYGSWVRFDGSANELQLRRDECVLYGSGRMALGVPFSDPNAPVVRFSVR